jgi:hypothetical protein
MKVRLGTLVPIVLGLFILVTEPVAAAVVHSVEATGDAAVDPVNVQAAIDAAGPGDTVLLLPGPDGAAFNFTDPRLSPEPGQGAPPFVLISVKILHKQDLTVRGGATIASGAWLNTPFEVVLSQDVVLRDLTFEDGFLGVIFASCRRMGVVDSTFVGQFHAGIGFQFGGDGFARDNTFTNVNGSGGGGAIFMSTMDGTFVLENNRIRDSFRGFFVALPADADVTIRNNTIEAFQVPIFVVQGTGELLIDSNRITGGLTGIQIQHSGMNAEVLRNQVRGVSGAEFAGLRVVNVNEAARTQVRSQDNEYGSNVRGARISGFVSASFADDRFDGNDAVGVLAEGPVTVTIEESSIVNTVRGPATCAVGPASITVRDSLLRNNAGGDACPR